MFTTLLIGGLLLVIGYAVRGAFTEAKKKVKAVDGDRAGAGGAAPVPMTLEGRLAELRVRGEISHRLYQQALARLAARDEQQHPLSAPEKGDSSTEP